MKEKKKSDPEVLSLMKRRKKGLLKIVFSRFGVSALLLILQIVLIYLVLEWCDEDLEWFTIAAGVFTVAMFLHLFRSDMDATSKLTWLVFLLLFPIPISILLWCTEKDIGHRRLSRRLREIHKETKKMIPQDETVLSEPDITDSSTDALCRFINLTACLPVYRDTEVRFFSLGEYKFEAMIEELRKAKRFIFLEYFIIDEGYMWGRILKILAEKAAEGVEVRVMYDGMCEISTLSSDYPKRLARLGIKCKSFSKIYPFLSTQYNYRDHRKILVIDGRVAFNGGVNLADEYINRRLRFGHWKDTAVMLRGRAVESFTLMFLQMWNVSEKNEQWDEFLSCSPACEGRGFVMPYCDSPLDGYKVGECVYLDMINRATKYVHIMTPYLVLDNELEMALKFAAQRGVDVKLILPGIPDKKAAYALAKSYYKYLIKEGVRIYEYIPGFVHAKIFVCDGVKATVGTINLDYRSLYHHFECGTYLYKTDCIQEIEEDFQFTLGFCRSVTTETIAREKLSYRFLGSLAKLVAPLM